MHEMCFAHEATHPFIHEQECKRWRKLSSRAPRAKTRRRAEMVVGHLRASGFGGDCVGVGSFRVSGFQGVQGRVSGLRGLRGQEFQTYHVGFTF